MARLQDQLATKTVKLESAAAAAQSLLQQMSVSTGQAEADRQRVAAIVEGVTAKVGRREAVWRTGDEACLGGGRRWYHICLELNYYSPTLAPTKQKSTQLPIRQASQIATVKNDAEKELEEAQPALQAALAALNSITPTDITSLKALKNPPNIVKRIFDCVLLLR